MSSINNITNYLQYQSRNKIIFYTHNIQGITPLNVGFGLSQKLKSLLNDTKIGMKAHFIIDELFSYSIIEDGSLGKYLALQNLGILFEPELKTDFIQILDKYSSSNTLFVKWDGEIEDGILYFLTKEKGQKIDIKNLSHIVI